MPAATEDFIDTDEQSVVQVLPRKTIGDHIADGFVFARGIPLKSRTPIESKIDW